MAKFMSSRLRYGAERAHLCRNTPLPAHLSEVKTILVDTYYVSDEANGYLRIVPTS